MFQSSYFRNTAVCATVFLLGAHIRTLDASLRKMMSAMTAELNTWSERIDETPDENLNYQLAYDESYGLFDNIPQEDWEIYQNWARIQGDHRYRPNPTRQWGNPALWYYNNFNPIFNCPHAQRVQGIGDGPKWVCDPHRLKRQAERRKAAGESGPHCLIYSIGSNGNYEFEDGMFGINGEACEIHIFDFSNNYTRPQNAEKNIHFHQWGLQGSQQDRHDRRGEFVSFPQILKRLGHENRIIDIFKIDCEGCEWDSFKDWIGYPGMRQILVETHALPADQALGFDYFKSYRNHSLCMFSKEVNGFGDAKFYEFSYVKLHPDFLYPPTTPAVEGQ